MLLLDRGALEQALPIEEVISAVEEAFRAYQQGGVEVPLRSSLKTGEGMILYMPALLPNFRGSAILGTKIITVFGRNPQKGLPLIHALYLLFDPTSGRPLALLEGSYLTAMRTGATSAVAARYLARADAKSLGIIGAGYQAFFQAWAISQVRRIERAYLYDQVAERARKLADRLNEEFSIEARAVASPEELVKRVDILVTATTAREPVFPGRALREGMTVIVIGAFTPAAREVDDETSKRSKIHVDSREGALAEAGDLLIPMQAGLLIKEEIKGELGEVVIGAVPGREGEEEIILFKSVGLAIEDAAAANVAYARAIELGIGREVEVT